jgi:uncharacterized protein with GYD domain
MIVGLAVDRDLAKRRAIDPHGSFLRRRFAPINTFRPDNLDLSQCNLFFFWIKNSSNSQNENSWVTRAAYAHGIHVNLTNPRRSAMITYVVLASFTDQGIRNAKDTMKRAEAFKDMAKKFGVTVREIFWTQGQYDIVTITEAPDELSATALNLSLCALGNIRTQSLRAFSAVEMKAIIGKMV